MNVRPLFDPSRLFSRNFSQNPLLHRIAGILRKSVDVRWCFGLPELDGACKMHPGIPCARSVALLWYHYWSDLAFKVESRV